MARGQRRGWRVRAAMLVVGPLAASVTQSAAAQAATGPVVSSVSPIAAPARSTVTIHGGPFPGARLPGIADTHGSAVGPTGQSLYVVTSTGSGMNVVDIDPSSPTFRTVTTSLPVPAAAGTVTAPSGYIYVSDIADHSITVIDAAPGRPTYNAIVGKFSVPTSPAGIAFTSDGSRAYVGSFDESGRVLELTFSTSAFPDAITPIDGFGMDAHALTLSADGRRAYVVSTWSNRVSYLDTDPTSPTYRSIIASVSSPGGPRHLTLTRDGRSLIVTGRDSGQVSFLDADPSSASFGTVTGQVFVGPGLQGVVLSADGTRAFVSIGATTGVAVVDVDPASPTDRTVLDTIPTGARPINIEPTPDGTAGYVSNAGTGDVSVLNLAGANDYIKTVLFGSTPASSFRVVNPSTVEAVVPPLNAQPVHVTVTTTAGTSSATDADLFTVTGRRTTTSLTVSSTSPTIIDPVTLLAHVAQEANPSFGRLKFWADDIFLGDAALDSNQNAQLVTRLPAGHRLVTAQFVGDALHDPSQASVPVDVSRLTADLSVTPPPIPTAYGRPAVFELKTSVWLGSVAIIVDGQPFDSITLGGGSQSYVTSALSPGDHVVTFAFAGNKVYDPIAVSVSHHVDRAPTVLQAEPLLALTVPKMQATAIRPDTGQRLAGLDVAFFVGGRDVCHATTDSSGLARCTSETAAAKAIIALGYKAVFTGTTLYAPSEDHGGLRS